MTHQHTEAKNHFP